MLNMIRLDWLGMKCYRKRIIILPIIVSSYGIISEVLIIPFIAFMMLSFSVNPFAVEEKGKLDNLYLTLPITRRTIVSTRYCLSLLMQLVGLVFGVLVTVVMARLLYGKTILFAHTFTADFPSVALLVCGSLLLYAVMNLSMFPTLFKIGYAKGKALGFYIPVAGVTVLLFALYMLWYLSDGFHLRLLSALAWAQAYPLGVCALLLAAAALFLTGSYLLSCLLYSRREL